jgi:hypothetical protein
MINENSSGDVSMSGNSGLFLKVILDSNDKKTRSEPIDVPKNYDQCQNTNYKAYLHSVRSINIPTENEKRSKKRSLTGFTSSICSA